MAWKTGKVYSSGVEERRGEESKGGEFGGLAQTRN